MRRRSSVLSRRAIFERVAASLYPDTVGHFPFRGNSDARWLLIAPPFSVADSEANLPFSSTIESRWFEENINRLGWSTDTDFVVTCCTDDVGGTVKANTQGFRAFIAKCVDESLFDAYFCVGSDAFKTAFGNGKKPTMRSLVGNVMTIPETGFKKLFVFPDIEAMGIQPTKGDEYRAQERAVRMMDTALKVLKMRQRDFK